MAELQQNVRATIQLDVRESEVLYNADVNLKDFAELCSRTGATACAHRVAKSDMRGGKPFRSGSEPIGQYSCGLEAALSSDETTIEFTCAQYPCGDANAARRAADEVLVRVDRIEGFATSVANGRNR